MLTAITANITLLFIVAVLSESLTEILKNAFPAVVKDRITYVLSIVIGVGLAFAFGLNLFGLSGAGAYVSIVAAGILASRGANYLNGFLQKLGVVK